jgi:hypothetical protein
VRVGGGIRREVGEGEPVGRSGRVHGNQAIARIEFQNLFGETLGVASRGGFGGGTFEKGDEEKHYLPKTGKDARGEGGDGFVHEIAKVFRDQRHGGRVEREDGAEGRSIAKETVCEIAEVELCFVETGEIDGRGH